VNVVDYFKIAFHPFGKAVGIQPFLIVFLSRTGSNLLASKLDSHPEILCHHEVFRMDSIHMASTVKSGKRKMDLGFFEGRDRDSFAFLQRVYAKQAESVNGQACATKAIGIKFSHYQGKWMLLSLLLNRRIKKIVVRRDNVLASHVSVLRAARSGRWVKFADRDYSNQSSDLDSVHLNLARYFNYVRKADWFYRVLSFIFWATVQRVCRIEYREIAGGTKIPDLLRFLGVDPSIPLQAATAKQAKRRLIDRIENLEEVQQAFKPGSRHERWLGEE
jgi:LPS sulfotransferase NodH